MGWAVLRSATKRMEYRILGPLEVSAGGELLPLGPVKQRALLAVLLLNRGKIISRDRLIDELWGERAPKTAPKAIQNYVSRLRKLLPPQTLLTRTPGYVAELAPGELDLDRFEQFVDEGRKALASGDSEGSAALLREALELWRGPALVEFESEPFAQTEALRLEEMRLSAIEERIDVDLGLGRHTELVGELETLVIRHPLRERLRGQLMLALYRSGRQAEALTAYQNARATLVDELGIDPSRELQDLEQAILRQDSSLTLPEPFSVERHSDLLDKRREPRARDRPRAPSEGRDRVRSGVGFRESSEVFVGREAEIGRLEALLHQALDGDGQLVMLVGEAGIGKTRLAAELSATAEQMGASTYWGRCHEREGAPPYWPWVQALRLYVRERDPEWLRSEMAMGAPEIAEVIPEVKERLSDLTPSRPLDDPKQARFHLFDSLALFLRRATEARPLVLVLDDLHWADSDSLGLLEFVALELAGTRLLVIGTYRDVELPRRHPLSETLAELAREHRAERIHLGGLSQDDVARCIEAASGIVPPAELAEAVHTQTAGNPFFVTEVVRLLEEEGELSPERLDKRESWELGASEGVRDIIDRRLARLSDPCGELVRLASVLGREFTLEQLARLHTDRGEDELADLLEEARTAGLLAEIPDYFGRYEFTHALVQDTLAAGFSSTRRVRLHAQIAQALEELYGVDAEAHAAELSHHFAQAEPVLGNEKLTRYSQLAGRRALAAHAFQEAITQFERALTAKEDQPMDAETAELLSGLAQAELAGRERSERREAVARLAAAFDYFAQAGEERRAVEVVAHPIPPTYGAPEVPELISRALALVPDDSHEAGRLFATLGWFTGVPGADYESAREAFDRSLAIAVQHSDTALETRALVDAAHVDWFHTRWHECRERCEQAIPLALADTAQRPEMIARTWAARIAAIEGRLEDARLHATASLAHANKLQERYWLATVYGNLAWVAILAGDWAAARESIDEGLALEPDDARHLTSGAILEHQVGDPARGDAYIDRLTLVSEGADPAPAPGLLAGVIPLVGRISGDITRQRTAEAVASSLLSSPETLPHYKLFARSGLVHLAVERADAASIEEEYAALESQRGTALVCFGVAADRLLGLLAAGLGDWQRAFSHFDDALSFCSRAGYRPEYAWTAFDYGEALLGQARPGDLERAVGLYDEALSVARELGMRPVIKRVLARQ